MTEIDESPRPSGQETEARQALLELFKRRPIPDDAILDHLEVFLRPQRIAELLALAQVYQRIIEVHGVVMEFGVRWGRHLSVFAGLRATLEPTNFYRRIIGFDTFAGFEGIDVSDGSSDRVHEGAMSVSEGYEAYLAEVLALHEMESPMSHIRRFELCKGDAPVALESYLERHPETIVALAYFDMDLYRPTKECLELLRPHLTRGSVLAFDEVMHPDFPGEAIAVKEALELSNLQLRRVPYCPYPSFVVM